MPTRSTLCGANLNIINGLIVWSTDIPPESSAVTETPTFSSPPSTITVEQICLSSPEPAPVCLISYLIG